MTETMSETISSLDPWLLAIITGVSLLLALVAIIYIFALINKSQPKKKASPGKKRQSKKEKRRQEFARELTQQLTSRRLREVYTLLNELTSTLNYQRVLDKALDLSMQALTSYDDPEDRLVGIVLLFAERDKEAPELYIGSSRRLTPADYPQTFPASKGLLRQVVDEGDPVLIKNVAQDPELGRLIALQTCRAAYCIPLRQGIDTYGVILFAHPKEDFFNSAHREILNIIAKGVGTAIQNARLYQELGQEKERMMEVQEEARTKLARDLHDGPAQSIAAIAMRINFARRLLERDQGAAVDELYKIEDFARRTTKEIRHMLFTLRPLVLEAEGLTAALQSMADKMEETYDQNVVLDISEEVVSKLDMDKQGVIFFIIEEAVNNARKHAEADHIWVRLKQLQKDLALLAIEDDGVGFDVEMVKASYEHSGSLGMINLRERTDLINGVLRVDSSPGEGTTIQVAIPLTEDAVDRIRHSM